MFLVKLLLSELVAHSVGASTPGYDVRNVTSSSPVLAYTFYRYRFSL